MVKLSSSDENFKMTTFSFQLCKLERTIHGIYVICGISSAAKIGIGRADHGAGRWGTVRPECVATETLETSLENMDPADTWRNDNAMITSKRRR